MGPTISGAAIALKRRGLIDYQTALESQRRIHEEVAAGVRPNTLILLEHPSVYTAGRRTEIHERPLDGTPVVDVDRGGKITWHGEGQLVGYPIILSYLGEEGLSGVALSMIVENIFLPPEKTFHQ